MKRIVAAGAIVVLSSLMGFEGRAAPDEGEARASEYHSQKNRCAQVVQYGEKPVPAGLVTGDPEKDTHAYPVRRIDTVCAPARP